MKMVQKANSALPGWITTGTDKEMEAILTAMLPLPNLVSYQPLQ